jgi:molybdopterin-guanine dinucleotide biosynthesis protein A
VFIRVHLWLIHFGCGRAALSLCREVPKTVRKHRPAKALQTNIPVGEISILAGGASSRMGRNKASLRLGRRTLLGHIRASAQDSGWPHRVIRRDLVPGCGPLGGVYTALATSRKETILFLSCDMPFVSGTLLKSLIRRLGARKNALFVKNNGRVGFPFLLRRATLPAVERLLAARLWSLQNLARALGAQTVPLTPRQRRHLVNINTPQEWRKAKEQWHAAAVASRAVPNSNELACHNPATHV